MDNRSSSVWLASAIHSSVSAFVVPFVARIFIGIPLSLILGRSNNLEFQNILGILNLFVMWGTIFYCAKFINKDFLIKDPKRVVILSTTYFAVIGGVYNLYQVIAYREVEAKTVWFVVYVVLFYFLSKKYIKIGHPEKL